MSAGAECIYADIDPQQERSIARRNAERSRLEPDEEWVDTQTAARLLCCAVHSLHSVDFTDAVERRSRSVKGNGPRAVGWLWRKADLLELARVRRVCRLRLGEAAKVVAAMREGRL